MGVDRVVGPPLQIKGPVMRWGDAHLVKERGKDFLEADRSVVWFGRLLVRRADYLAVSHSASREEAEVRLGPMISSTLRIDLGGPSEFSPANYADVAVEPAFVQIFDK